GRAEAASAHVKRPVGLAMLDRLAVGLAVEYSFLDDLPVIDDPQLLVALARGGRHRHPIGDRPHHQHHQAVHVEGERGGGIPLCELLRHEAIGFEVSPEPAKAFWHAQAQKTLDMEVRIVVEGKRRVAIMAFGARSEARPSHPAGKIEQLPLAGRRLELHLRAHSADHGLRLYKPPTATELQVRRVHRSLHYVHSGAIRRLLRIQPTVLFPIAQREGRRGPMRLCAGEALPCNPNSRITGRYSREDAMTRTWTRRQFGRITGAGLAAPFLWRAERAWAQGGPVTLKLGHPDTTLHPNQAIAQKLSEMVSEKTHGAVKIQVFAGGQLGSETNLISGMQTGIVDMAMHTTGFLE